MLDMFGEFSWWILGVFFAYFAALIGIAVVRARQMRGMSDYVLGGRRVGSLVSALSSSSSATSAWTVLVLPALAFASGVVHMWTVLGLVSGVWLGWTIIAKRLRRYTIAADESLTLPEFMEKRFDDRSGALRTLAGFITIFFVIFYISSGLIAGASLLDTVFGLSWGWGIVITLVAVASYTFIGGFLAVSKTDVFQAMLMLACLTTMPIALVFIAADDPLQGLGATSLGFWNPLIDADGSAIGPFFILSAAGWGLGFMGSQRVVQRFMAVESEEKIKPSRDIGTVWLIVIFSFALLLGLAARPALSEVGLLSSALENPSGVYLLLSDIFFHPLVTGLLLTAVVAAVMSTADSQLLLASAIATDDMPLLKRYAYSLTTHGRVWLGRALLVVVGIVAALLLGALDGIAAFLSDTLERDITLEGSIASLVAYAWGGMGAAFGPVTIMSLYWRRFNFWGALTSIVTGTLVASIWWGLSGGPGGLWDIQPATPGFLFAIPAAVVVTLLTPKPSDSVVKLFDQVNPPKTERSISAGRTSG